MKSAGLKKDNAILNALRCIVIGSISGAILCAFLLAIVSLGFVQAKHIPQAVVEPMVVAISGISAFFAGYITVRLSRKSGLAFGAMAGFLLFLLFFLAGFLAAHDTVELTTLTRLAIMVLAGAIGGFVAVSRKKRIK